MAAAVDRPEAPSPIRTDLGAIFVSLELSRSTWLITSLSPGGGKLSKHSVRGSDVAALLERFAHLKEKARARTREVFPLIRHPGSWARRFLDPPGPAVGRYRKPCRRSGFNRDIAPAPAGKD